MANFRTFIFENEKKQRLFGKLVEILTHKILIQRKDHNSKRGATVSTFSRYIRK